MDYKKLGRMVTEMRDARGWSRRRLSQEAGVSESTLKHMEDGERPDGVPYAPSANTLRQVAEAFGQDGPDLLEAYGEPRMAEWMRSRVVPIDTGSDNAWDHLTPTQQRSLRSIFDELVKLIAEQPTPVGSNRAKGVYLHSVA